MGLSIQDSIDTAYIDTAHYNVSLEFSIGFEILDRLTIHNASNLMPFTYVDGDLKTPEYTIETYVTAMQDRQLQQLYAITMHPGYVDLRYPVLVSWGHPIDEQYIHQVKCYLSSYTPPDSVNFSNAEMLSSTLVLRAI